MEYEIKIHIRNWIIYKKNLIVFFINNHVNYLICCLLSLKQTYKECYLNNTI